MKTTSEIILTGLCLGMILFLPLSVRAHCDTLDGPVVVDAKQALEKGDATPVLKWVKKADEPQVRIALQKALKVRDKGPEAKDLAETFFFETVVRLHRASEGAPYTGLKPAGTDPGPVVREGDKSLETGSADHLVKHLAHVVSEGIRHRFDLALEKKKHADENVEAGRSFVSAYVDFIHYLERLDGVASGHSPHGEALEAHGRSGEQHSH
jgi:hypothetical protein